MHFQQSRGQVSSPLQRNISVAQRQPQITQGNLQPFILEPRAKKCQVTCWSSPAWAVQGVGLGDIIWDHASSPGSSERSSTWEQPHGTDSIPTEPEHSPGGAGSARSRVREAGWQTSPKPIPTTAAHPRPHTLETLCWEVLTPHSAHAGLQNSRGKAQPGPGSPGSTAGTPRRCPRHIPGLLRPRQFPKPAPGCSRCPCVEAWKSHPSRAMQAGVPRTGTSTCGSLGAHPRPAQRAGGNTSEGW